MTTTTGQRGNICWERTTRRSQFTPLADSVSTREWCAVCGQPLALRLDGPQAYYIDDTCGVVYDDRTGEPTARPS